ncbi:MAG: hypothetical protein AAFP20_22830 [Cyanobacteria bacterium J06614_10]
MLKKLLLSGAGLIVFTLMLWAGSSLMVKRQSAKMDELAQEALAQYPATQTNDAARTLHVLVGELGIASITSQEEPDDVVPDPVQANALQAMTDDLSDYFEAQGQKTEGTLDPIPENLQTYLEQNLDALSDVQAHLRSGEPLVWEFDADQVADFSFAVPSFLGLAQLQQLLALKAIYNAEQNQPDEMAAALEATLAINEALSERPELISYLVSLIVMNRQMSVMRHLEGVPTELSNRLLAIDQQQIGSDRLSFEGWIMYVAMQKMLASSGDPGEYLGYRTSALLRYEPLHRNYLMLSSLDTARRMAQSYRRLPDLTICSGSLETLHTELALTASWWNMLGKIAMPSLLRQWQKGGQSMLAAELTHHIVTAKALAAEQGQWPDTLPTLESQTCPGEQWVYEVSPAGDMSLSFSHELGWLSEEQLDGTSRSLVPPLSYQASRWAAP